MTAILGFNYLNGVLMMADTEETTSLATKSDCDKLCRFTFMIGEQVGTVITGGAGDAHLIEYANQELEQFLASGEVQITSAASVKTELLVGLNAFSRRMFQETTAQYAGFAYDLVPTFGMLMTINYQAQSFLFRWTHNRVVLVPYPQHVSLGSGSIQLHPMLRDIQFSATKESMLFLGIKMMFQAKRIVQGVGGKTEAIALEHDGTTYHFGLDTTKKIEDLVVNFEQFLNKFVYTSLSNVASPVRELEKNVKDAFALIPGWLHQYREQYKNIVNPALPEIRD